MDYNKVASEYNSYSKEATSDWLIAYPKLMELLQPIKEKTILDYGCGTGKVSRLFRDEGSRVIGVDISLPMLNIAKQDADRIDYHHIDGGHINFIEDSRVHEAFAAFVFCNVASRNLAIEIMKNVNRVLKPGGRFVILNANWEDCNGREFVSYHFDYFEKLESGQKVNLTLKSSTPLKVENYFWSAEDYQSMLQESGFEQIKIHKPLASSHSTWNGEDKYPLFLIIEATKL